MSCVITADSLTPKVTNCLTATATSQLTNRFKAMNEVINKFSILFPSVLTEANDEDIQKAAERLSLRSDRISCQTSSIQCVTKTRTWKTVISSAAGTVINHWLCHNSSGFHGHRYGNSFWPYVLLLLAPSNCFWSYVWSKITYAAQCCKNDCTAWHCWVLRHNQQSLDTEKSSTILEMFKRKFTGSYNTPDTVVKSKWQK